MLHAALAKGDGLLHGRLDELLDVGLDDEVHPQITIIITIIIIHINIKVTKIFFKKKKRKD